MNITDPKDYTITGIYSIDASFKRDKHSTETKHVVLRVHLNNVPLRDVIVKALSPTRITWQNNVARPKYDTWRDRQVVDIDFTSPGTKVKSDEEKIAEMADSFMKAGLPKKKALELATKAVKDPQLVQPEDDDENVE